MEILRLKKEVIRLNNTKTIEKDVFRDTYKGVDKIELDNSLFTIALAKYEVVKPEEILFSDAIVKIEFEPDKDIIDRIIEINNSKYAFYMATASDLKKSSCIFIKEEYYQFGQWLKEQSTAGLEYILTKEDETTIMKNSAYMGFVFSGSQKTNIIPKVVIIEEPEYLYRGLHTVLEGVETSETIDDIKLVEKEIETTLSAFDGQGVADINLMNRIAKDLNIEHQLNWITFRLYAGIGGKGVATALDIQKELLRVNKLYGDTENLYMQDGELIVVDIWNRAHRVSEVDMILNESQCKLVKHFDADYLDSVFNKVDDIFKCLYICKHNKNKLRSDRTRLNYQFLQVLNLSYEELLELTKNDREHLDKS
ncbi:MAG: RNA dependent RNA polymerase, partial [Paraclostridium sp.]